MLWLAFLFAPFFYYQNKFHSFAVIYSRKSTTKCGCRFYRDEVVYRLSGFAFASYDAINLRIVLNKEIFNE
jgi:hypothetical protein